VFKEPKPLAHLAGSLVIIGILVQSLAIYLLDWNEALIGLATVFYLTAFPFSVLTLMRNWRVPRERRIDLLGSIEVGLGILPSAITIVLVSYYLWFTR